MSQHSPEQIRQAFYTVLRAIAPEADPARIDEDADLREELEIDSMDVLNLAVGLHEKLGVDVPEADYVKLTRVSTAVPYLQSRAPR